MGRCVAIPDDSPMTNARTETTVAVSDYKYVLLNKLVYFDEFEDTTNYKIDGKTYALIEIKNIRGYEDDK